jgi:hypothetical protein
MGFSDLAENYKRVETRMLLQRPFLGIFRRGFAEVPRPLRGGLAEKTDEKRVKKFFEKFAQSRFRDLEKRVFCKERHAKQKNSWKCGCANARERLNREHRYQPVQKVLPFSI